MSTIIEVMLAIRDRSPVFYHKDAKQFDRLPYSKAEKLNPNVMLTTGKHLSGHNSSECFIECKKAF